MDFPINMYVWSRNRLPTLLVKWKICYIGKMTEIEYVECKREFLFKKKNIDINIIGSF